MAGCGSGCASLFGRGVGAAARKGGEFAAERKRVSNLKRGKTDDQKYVIDFFNPIIETSGKASSGTKMKMAEYQKIVSNRLYEMNLRDKAIEKIGLDESEVQEIPPIILSGYVFDSSNEDIMVRVVYGEAVSSRFSVSWIFFSAMQLYAYTYTFDTISDCTWEQTQDFFYQDITCFKTTQRVVEVLEFYKPGRFAKEIVERNNYITDELEITVPGESISFSLRNNDTIEESLQAAKAMMRERKFVH